MKNFIEKYETFLLYIFGIDINLNKPKYSKDGKFIFNSKGDKRISHVYLYKTKMKDKKRVLTD